MHTVRCSGNLPKGVSAWLGWCLLGQEMSAWLRELGWVSAWPGVVCLAGGCLLGQGGVCLARVMSAWPGGGVSAQGVYTSPLWTE